MLHLGLQFADELDFFIGHISADAKEALGSGMNIDFAALQMCGTQPILAHTGCEDSVFHGAKERIGKGHFLEIREKIKEKSSDDAIPRNAEKGSRGFIRVHKLPRVVQQIDSVPNGGQQYMQLL